LILVQVNEKKNEWLSELDLYFQCLFKNYMLEKEVFSVWYIC